MLTAIRKKQTKTSQSYHRAKKASSIQFGYWKWVTPERVLSSTPPRGNGKNEIIQEIQKMIASKEERTFKD